jgi:hypothetical protein
MQIDQFMRFVIDRIRSFLTPQPIVQAVFGYLDKPCTRIVRRFAKGPFLECRNKGVLHRVLDRVDVPDAKNAAQNRNHLSGVMPEQMV